MGETSLTYCCPFFRSFPPKTTLLIRPHLRHTEIVKYCKIVPLKTCQSSYKTYLSLWNRRGDYCNGTKPYFLFDMLSTFLFKSGCIKHNLKNIYIHLYLLIDFLKKLYLFSENNLNLPKKWGSRMKD